VKLYESHSIEYMRLSDLKEDPCNPKAHDEKAIEESIRHFSIIEPFVIDGRTGFLVSGHGRRKALLSICENKGPLPNGASIDEEGYWTVPVVTGWSSKSDREAHAALIALNRTTELGGWVDETLLSLLDELQEMDDDYPLGFTDEDREALRRLTEAEEYLSTAWVPTGDDGPDDLSNPRMPGLARDALPPPPLEGHPIRDLGAYRTLVVRVSDEEAYRRLVEFIGTPMRRGAGNGTESYWYGEQPERRRDATQQAQTVIGDDDDAPDL